MSAVAELRTALRGEVVAPGEAAYDAARTVWNAMIDRRPAAIARVADEEDVVAALEVARRHDMPVAVRGGGHGVAGTAVCDGGVVIDFGGMRAVEVDARSRVVRMQAGARLGDLDRATHPHGLAVPAGIVSETGAAGLTLGGGIGWLHRRHGLTIDNLLAVDLVLADGRRVRASASEHEDLFWGVRGGGGNFGAVTAFTYRARPVDLVTGGALFYELDEPAAFLDRYRAFCAEAPEELTVDALLIVAEPAPFLPERLHGRTVGVLALCHSGDPADAARMLAPLRAGAAADLVEPRPFPALQSLFDAGNPAGRRHYWKSGHAATLSDALIATLADRCAEPPSPHTTVDTMLLGGAVAAVEEDATAYAHRDAGFLVSVQSTWEDAADSERQVAWTRETWSALAPHTAGGGYVNYVAAEEEAQAPAVYGARAYERLRAIKREHDPDNVFASNHNVDPRAA